LGTNKNRKKEREYGKRTFKHYLGTQLIIKSECKIIGQNKRQK
jgi:hypothetical protein